MTTKNRSWVFAWITLVISVQPALGASTVTLRQCYEFALGQSEILKINEEVIKQITSARRVARSAALPELSWEFANVRQDVSGVNSGNSGSDRTSTDKSRTTSNFRLFQPIFAGFGEFAAMSSLLSEREREELFLKRARENLYGQVARVYYGILQLEADLANVATNMRLTEERIGELKDRVRLGKSRRSELLSSESQLDNLAAEQIRISGLIVREREALSFLTGQDMSQAFLVDQLGIEKRPPVEEAIKRAEFRNDVQALAADAESKRKAIRVANALFYPTADVEGNYYTQRPGLLQDSDWDVIFSANVPIFQGGAAVATRSEAKSRYREAELNLQRLRRDVASQVKMAISFLESSLLETEKLKAAYRKARESYQLHVREYRFGLVNNLEVLAAQNIMQDVKHDLDRATLDTKINHIDLMIAMGAEL